MADVGVLGLPDDDLGEIVGAVVVPHPESDMPTVDELRALCQQKLARYEMPERWWLRREQLPMSGIGKIAKRELAEQWENRGFADLVEDVAMD